MSILNELKGSEGSKTTSKRLGRGIGSGKGKTSGRGQKGQKARSGVSINGFEGGQMPIFRRLPKRGFNNPTRKEVETVNIAVLEDFIERKRIDAKKTITQEILLEAGLVSNLKHGVKLLNKGEVKSKFTIEH